MVGYKEQLENLKQQKFTWLVTGCAGFIGTNLAKKLLEHNQKVIGIDNFISGKKENITLLSSLSNNFTFIEDDLRQYKTCVNITTNVDYVLHQAALGSISRSLSTPILSHDCNVNSFINLLEASLHNKVKRFIFESQLYQTGQRNSFLGHFAGFVCGFYISAFYLWAASKFNKIS